MSERTRPRVSVVMPCFNAAKTVDQAVESILADRVQDLELIAVEDGSTDHTLDRLADWQVRDSRVRLIKQPHLGLIATLNTGWRAAWAPLIARMDADDLSHPDRLTEQLDLLRRRPGLAGVGTLVEGFSNRKGGKVREGLARYIQWQNSLTDPESIARERFVESPLAHSSVLLEREWLARVGGYQDHGWPEDYDLWLRMIEAGARFAKVERVLLRWRDHAKRATRTDRRYSVRQFLRAKAHYLMRGPLQSCQALFVWGAGQMGRRLSRHLLNLNAPIVAFVDIDPKKIGGKKRGRPVIGRDELKERWGRQVQPKLVAAVGSHGAREKIRDFLSEGGWQEGVDWWAAA